MTSLSLYFSPINAHINVDGKAINWTNNKAIITELDSNPKFNAKVDANAITVWTPSINKKNAIKNIKAFLYWDIDLKVLKIFLKDVESRLVSTVLVFLSLYVMASGIKNIDHHTETVINDHLIASAWEASPNISGYRLIIALIRNKNPPPKYPHAYP